MASLQEALIAALDYLDAGKLAEADLLCSHILDAVPEHPDALHIWGVCAARTGHLETAAQRVRRAITQNGAAPHYHVTLGTALGELGRIDEAVAAYRAALRLDPHAPAVAYRLGRALDTLGMREEAVAAYRGAACTDPAHFDAYCRLGEAHQGLGRAPSAVAAYRAALALDSRNARLHYNLGLALQEALRPGEALAAYRAAADRQADFPEAHFNRGNLLHALGRPDEAIAAYETAIRQRPAYAEAQCNLGNALLKAGRPDEAASAGRAAVGHGPGVAEAHCTLGNALKELGRFGESLESYRAAIACGPAFPAAWTNMGFALHALGRLDEAAAAHRTALRAVPGLAEAHVNLGLVRKEQGCLDEAVAASRRAVALAPGLSEAQSNLGLALKAMGRLEEASSAHRRAVALAPESPESRLNWSLLLLGGGDFAKGWPEYEWRWRTRMQRDRGFSMPQWRGGALEGRTILLHAEQGLGDTLQFVRYVPMVAQRGGTVVLEVPAPLTRLLSRLPGVARIVARGTALPDCDLHCPLLSLPLAFGTRLDSVPAEIPYLEADPALRAAWAERIPQDGRLKVGLVWAGSPQPGHRRVEAIDRQRSVTLAQLAPLAGTAGVRFHSLQKHGEAARQADTPPAGLELTDLMAGVGDFADTAALVEQLDLVIGVDTSVIHLAGGLGKPVWTLSRYDGCWRWLNGRSDSPWYPTLRLYRQDRPDDWDGAIGRLAADLRAWAAAR